jgi:RHS repeat-associated protein
MKTTIEGHRLATASGIKMIRALVATFFLLLLCASVGAEVRLPNGEYTETNEDLKVKVLGGFVTVARSWTNGRWYVNPAWADLNLTFDSLDGSVKALDRAGSIYERSGNGVFIFDNRFFISTTPTGFRWYDQRGSWITYDSAGHMTAYGDRNNVQVSFVLDANGQRTQVNDHFGNLVLTFQYAGGKLSGVTDRTGRTVQYAYTGNNLTQVTDVLGNPWTYTYDGNGQITSRTDPEGHTTTIVYAQSTPAGTPSVGMKGYLANNLSIGAGVAAKSGSSATVSSTGSTPRDYKVARVFTVTDPEGNKTTFLYDYDRVARQYTVTQKFTTGRTVVGTYDSDGFLRQQQIGTRSVRSLVRDGDKTELVANERGLVTRTDYDAARNPLKISYPDGTAVANTYDAVYSNPLTRIDEIGVTTLFAYDSRGNLLSTTEAAGLPEQRITTYTYDSYGQQLTRTQKGATATLDATTTFAYDSYGNVSTVIDPLGHSTGYTYDVIGNAQTRKDARGNTWGRTFNGKGWPLTNFDPLGHGKSFSYDRAGNLVSTTFADGTSESRSYKKNNWLVTIKDPLGGLVQFEHDAEGHVLKSSDPNGQVMLYGYDTDGRKTSITNSAGNTVSTIYGDATNALGGLIASTVYPTYTEEYKYDQRSRVTAITEVLNVPTSPNYITAPRRTTRFGYDARGDLISETDAAGHVSLVDFNGLRQAVRITDPRGDVRILSYDNRGNPTQYTDPAGNMHRYQFDLADRRVSDIRPTGRTIVYQYDENDNPTAITNPAGDQRRFAFDAANRRIQEQQFAMQGGVLATLPSRTIGFVYNSRNELTGYDDGTTIGTFAYDARALMVSESINFGPFTKSVSYGYQANGQLTLVTYADGSSDTYSLDSVNHPLSVTGPGGNVAYSGYIGPFPGQITVPGVTTAMSYDALLRPARIRVQANGTGSPGVPLGAVVMDHSYSFDEVDNILVRATEDGTYQYGYDPLDQLITATPPPALQRSTTNPNGLPAEQYTYDGMSNRLSSSAVPGAWLYNADNQLLQIGQGPDLVTYAYDLNGNLGQRVDATGSRVFTYDPAGHLIGVADNGAAIADYYYDPFGRRLTKTVGATTTYFQYSVQGLIGEFDASGQLTRSFGWRPQSTFSSNPLYMRTGSQTYFFHNDALGTPQHLTDVSGQVVWTGRAEAFGRTVVDASSTVANPLRFSGQYHDDETGLEYNFSRYYDAMVGRYIGEDILGLAAGPNVYAYAFGNPVVMTDPFGLKPVHKYECVYDPLVFDSSGCVKVDEQRVETTQEYSYIIAYDVLWESILWPERRKVPKLEPDFPTPEKGHGGGKGGRGGWRIIWDSPIDIGSIYIDKTGGRLDIFYDLEQMFRNFRTVWTYTYECYSGVVCTPSAEKKVRTLTCDSGDTPYGEPWKVNWHWEFRDMTPAPDPLKPFLPK